MSDTETSGQGRSREAKPDRVSSPLPFPEGHGIQHPHSAVCVCGVLIHKCPAMTAWGEQRQAQVAERGQSAELCGRPCGEGGPPCLRPKGHVEGANHPPLPAPASAKPEADPQSS